MMNEKVIITDVDGVLLDWLHGFTKWMKERGHTPVNPDAYKIHVHFDIDPALAKQYVRAFNESADIAFLTPHQDAVKYVRKLYIEKGYVFHVVTSQSNNLNAQELRKQNLKNVFGEALFEEFTILDTGADKNGALKKYRGSGCYWIEDKPENAEVGVDLGLEGILMEHDHNKDYLNINIKTAKNWKEVYEIITGA